MRTDALELLAALPVGDATAWADTAADFQRRDAEAILDPAGPPFTYITRPRGGRKTCDAAGYAVALHVTVAPPGSRSYVVAADADQARLVLDSVRGFLLRAPVLRERIRIEARRVVFATAEGEMLSTVEVLPADEASSYGLRPFLVVADELSVWPDTTNARGLWSAVVSAMPKVEGSRLVVTTSAGAPDHWSHGVLEHARTSSQWQVFETPGPLPWIAQDVLDEQRSLLTASAYARLHENRWVAGEDRLTTPEQVRACIGHSGSLQPTRRTGYVHGIDVGLVNDRTVLTIAHAERRGDAVVVVVDHQEVWQGSKEQPVDLGDVEGFCRESLRKYPGKLIADPWQFKHTAQRLRSHGIRVEEFVFSSASVGRLALTLYRLLRDRLLDLPDDPDLVNELSSVVLRESQPGNYRIDTTGQGHDDRVISLALVAQRLASLSTATMHMEVAQGVIPAAPIGRPRRPTAEPPVAIVRDGAPRPADVGPVRLGRRFSSTVRRAPGFQGPKPR